MDAFVDQNAHYDGIPIRELKAQLRMPSDARGREDEYQRLFSVCYESREPHHNSSGAIVIHVSSVEYTLVAPVDNSHCRPAEKSERHNVFCQWVVDTFGHDELCAGSGVVEVISTGSKPLKYILHTFVCALCECPTSHLSTQRQRA